MEVWLRERPLETDPLRHLILCTFQQAREEIAAKVTAENVWARPHGLTPIGFHVRHIGGSVDRLLTYAEGGALSVEQLRVLQGELAEELPLSELLAWIEGRLDAARVLRLDPLAFGEMRYVGRQRIAVTLGSLLAHIAEHTQRHLGQIATTAKLIDSL